MPEKSATPRECTVLFADLVGSTQLYERAGDESAFEIVDAFVQKMRDVVESRGGRVVKHTGDGLMAVFEQAEGAAEAAINMHLKMRERVNPDSEQMGIKVGFHTGPVIESGEDVFGETVNQASRLAELASPGRALTSGETMDCLGQEWKGLLNRLSPRVLRGASRATQIYELKCESVGDVTVLQNVPPEAEGQLEIRLYLNQQRLVLNAATPIAHVGRESSADLKVGDSRASRRHADIELRGDKFVLVDHSSNGTYVAIEGEKEFFLSREEAVLHGRGLIALGGPCADNPYAIKFVCV